MRIQPRRLLRPDERQHPPRPQHLRPQHLRPQHLRPQHLRPRRLRRPHLRRRPSRLRRRPSRLRRAPVTPAPPPVTPAPPPVTPAPPPVTPAPPPVTPAPPPVTPAPRARHACGGRGGWVRRRGAGAAAAVYRAGAQRSGQSRRGELAAPGEGGRRRSRAGQAGPGGAGSRPGQAAAGRPAPDSRARLHQRRGADRDRLDDQPYPRRGARGPGRGAGPEPGGYVTIRTPRASHLGAGAAGRP